MQSLKKLASYFVVLTVGIVTLVSAALLGVTPGFPQFTFAQEGQTALTYDASGHGFSVQSLGTLIFAQFTSGDFPGTLTAVGSESAPQATININVDNSGNIIGPSTSRDFVLRGTVIDDGGTTYTGDLLTGSIATMGFGYAQGTSSTALFDFRFIVTGGTLANYPGIAGNDIGIVVTAENSNFDGGFTSSFSGLAKATIGPIAPNACGGSIGDFVWNDTNGNGIQDAGENGIGGVTVNLLNASNTVIATTTTNSSGIYNFGSLCAATYKVQVVPPAGYVATTTNATGSTTANDSNPNPSTVTLTSANPTDLTQDFGFYQPASLGDFVWIDSNANGVQDAGEVGINGVTVNLLKNNLVIATTTTVTNGNAGYYHFNNLAPGVYTVQFINPSGYIFSPALQGGNTALDSNPNSGGTTGNITLVSGQTDNTIDAGLYQLANLGDFVWNDTNANGIQDAGELGIAGVTVTLKQGSTTVSVTTTDANGLYHFTNLTPGVYSVAFAPPVGYVFSPQNAAGSTTANDSNADQNTGQTANVTLVGGQTDNTIDAGLHQNQQQAPAALGDFVWNDLNNNGIQDAGEPGLSGVVVKLLQGSTIVAVTTTDANGAYHFTGLTPGTYSVQFVAPTGFAFSPQTQGSNTAVDSNPDSSGVTGTINLASGQTDNTIDAGLFSQSTTTACSTSSNASNFNGTAISGGNYIWFTAVLKASNLGTQPVNLQFSNGNIQLGSTTIMVPNAKITFTPGATSASTTFDTGTGSWITSVPSSIGGNTLLTAVGYQVPAGGLVGGANPVTFNGSFTSDTLGVSVNWQWAAAVYTSFSGTYGALGVKPVDSNTLSTYQNSDQAGTPENYKSFVTGGARGGGGSNFTGSYSGTVTTSPCTINNSGAFTTYTQGGWGAAPHGNNPGAILTKYFTSVYPGGSVSIGSGTKVLKFTSASAIIAFLPQGGTPGTLAAGATNPTGSAAGVFAGQLLALRLSVDFSNMGLYRNGLASLTLASGPLAGQTVQQVLDLGNSVIAGGALPSGLSVSGLNDILNNLNNNYDNGTSNNGYLH